MVVRPRICVGARKAYGAAVRPAQSSFCYESPSRLSVAYPFIYVRKTCIRYHVGIILNRQRSHLVVAVELALTASDVHQIQKTATTQLTEQMSKNIDHQWVAYKK